MAKQAPNDFGAAKARKKPAGKDWESDFVSIMREIRSEGQHPHRLIRLKDSYDMGGQVTGGSDGDFILLRPVGKAVLLELKTSEVHETLLDNWSLIKKDQLAKHRFWHHLGFTTMFLFRSEPKHRFEFWDGRVVVLAAKNKGLEAGPFVQGGYNTPLVTLSITDHLLTPVWDAD